MNKLTEIVAVVGPTGSGKTKLGQAIASRYNGVIVSADSRQVYRGLDVGTNKEGKPGQWQGEPARYLGEIPQLLIDIVTVETHFTLADWLNEARRLIGKINSLGQRPIVVGGTGLYVSALLDNYALTTDKAIDFVSDYLIIRPLVDRLDLYDIADQRIRANFKSLINEVKGLITGGVSNSWLRRIGLEYRIAAEYLDHPSPNQEEFIQKLTFAEHAYIRRQDTWWRHHQTVNDVRNVDQAFQLADQFFHR